MSRHHTGPLSVATPGDGVSHGRQQQQTQQQQQLTSHSQHVPAPQQTKWHSPHPSYQHQHQHPHLASFVKPEHTPMNSHNDDYSHSHSETAWSARKSGGSMVSATSASSRSPSPGTHSDLGSISYAASTSSLATSLQPGTECNFQEGDMEQRESVGMGNKWNDETSRSPITPVSRFTGRPAKKGRYAPNGTGGGGGPGSGSSSSSSSASGTRSPSRPSSLRNAMFAVDPSAPHGPHPRSAEAEDMMSCESDAESGESEDDDMDIMGGYLDDNSSEEEEEEEDDNDWSGQNGNLERAVIEAVNGDMPLAAYLIPILHRDYSLAVKNKVESWQFGNTGSGTSGGGAQNLRERGNSDASRGEKSSYTNSPPGGSGANGNGNSRKRRRRSDSDGGGREGRGFGGGAGGGGRGSDDWGGGGGRGGDGGGDDGDEDEKNIDTGSGPGVAGNEESQPMLACPFHKRDPEKYGIQQTNSANGKKHKYRACTGPGFKSIQRLKEHLKRVHSPVQCNRCYKIFPGTDRATCLANLSEHQKESDACTLGDPSQKEGIDAVQWAALERQNRKKNQEAHKLEKWFEIWDVLFPGSNRPETPWHDIKPRITPFSPSKDGDAFSKLFLDILDHKIQHQDIDFNSMGTDIVRERLKYVVQQTFKAYVSLHGHLSTETSSSELSNGPSGGGRNRLSIVGGSSTHLSAPATAASHQMSNTTTGTAPTSIGMGTRNNNPQAAQQQMNPYAQHGLPTSPYHSHSHSHSHYGHHSPATPHQPQFMAHSPLNAAAMSAAGYTMAAEDPSIASASAVGVNGGGPAANYFYTSYAMFPPPPPHPATGTHAHAAWGAPGQFVAAHHPAAVQQFGMPHPAQQQIGSVGPHGSVGQVGQVTPDHMDVGAYQFEVEAGVSAFD
ncbi:hypothetical protein SMACR_09435 [Sordaria macrospora]|uniref:WGS project CABT00000000 data, contig 2.91 n=2 Tax=Sordaria macrospora TaxID=5147 RepID=F7WC10_SORMK|nr:uncharacterized protein SMAC_09435 [Sordaria macrospora k-hell]KAA8628457.1 hypothetical protein SMACR_09435 [Sordaria macrospora]WPJ65039.1 hypothetical protein SMAC4_09435 [Sordaria macrospora]CCC14535.1 unnamed protein product [Sordaria macrospora k-hell]